MCDVIVSISRSICVLDDEPGRKRDGEVDRKGYGVLPPLFYLSWNWQGVQWLVSEELVAYLFWALGREEEEEEGTEL